MVRENGRLEVYSDFMLVSDYLTDERQCVDIETDFNQFFLKFVINADKVTSETTVADLTKNTLEKSQEKRKTAFANESTSADKKPRYEIRQMRHFWRNRISFNTSSEKKNYEAWNLVVHNRISKYVQLYTQILDFSMHILVSHRNMISVFDMRKNSASDDWSATFAFKEGQVRKMFMKAREQTPKYQFETKTKQILYTKE